MNIHDLIESGLPVPRRCVVVHINVNAKNPANHWVTGFVDRYGIHVELTGGESSVCHRKA